LNVTYTPEELNSLSYSLPSVWHYPYTVGVADAKPGFRLRRTLSEALLYNSIPSLLRYADRNAMAFSLESRYPFLDYELVDFIISLPDDFYIRDGWMKWILREAAGDIIPDSIKWRADKVGYVAPLDNWLRNELYEWGYNYAFSKRLNVIKGYDKAALMTIWESHQAGSVNNSWAIWRWISLSIWLEMFDKKTWRTGYIAVEY
jgi:asparagine synthase (glutamine-hydrolysing)